MGHRSAEHRWLKMTEIHTGVEAHRTGKANVKKSRNDKKPQMDFYKYFYSMWNHCLKTGIMFNNKFPEYWLIV